MPHEVDYALLTAIQLKKSKYYLDLKNDSVTIEFVLNLSSYITNWSTSKLPKEFFKEKFKNLESVLKDYIFICKIYEGDELYGHLDAQRESIQQNIDHYISICPDMYFPETLLSYLINASKNVTNKYFVITPEISKLWDNTWDEITHEEFRYNDFNTWDEVDTFDVRSTCKNIKDDVYLDVASQNKWAGWFDLYNKAFWEQLCPVRDDWHGYGGLDFYSMIVSAEAVKKGYDFAQYILRNQIIFEYSVGPLKNGGFSGYYKNYLEYNNIPNQRIEWDKNLPKQVRERIKLL